MQNTNNSSLLGWLPLVSLSLMLTVPFLMAHHYAPIPTFFQEWVAATLGLLAFCHVLGKKELALELPEFSLLPIGLIFIALLQTLLLQQVIVFRIQLFALYLIWATMMLILGRHLANNLGLDKLSRWMAFATLAGALLEAGIAAMQLSGHPFSILWIFPHSQGTSLRGNLAQTNNFAAYLYLGIVAALYLRARNWLGRANTAVAITILVSFALLSGSRATWLYVIGIIALATWSTWRWPATTEFRHVRRWALLLPVIAIAAQLLFSSGLLSDHSPITAVSRLAQDGESSNRSRWAIWEAAWGMWQQHPLLGAGIGQFHWQHYLYSLELPPEYRLGPVEHAHNLPIHLLAETGIFALILLLVLSGRWVLGVFRQSWTPAHWFLTTSLLVITLQSGLEYPLWYAFYLGPAALMLGALSTSNYRLRLKLLNRPVLGALLLLGGLTLYNMRNDYGTLEDLINRRFVIEQDSNPQALFMEKAKLIAGTVFTPYLDAAVATLQAETTDALEIKLATCDRAMRHAAKKKYVFKCAHLTALAGRGQEAKLQLQHLAAAFPEDSAVVAKEWRARSTSEPELAPLAEILLASIATKTPR